MSMLSKKRMYAAVAIVMVTQRFQADDFKALVSNSNLFNNNHRSFPTTVNRITVIAGQDTAMQDKIVVHARRTYPLIHQNVRLFLERFLRYKKEYGTDKEKALYKNIDQQELVIRLLQQRPLMFMTQKDRYLLRSGNIEGSGHFESIGTKNESIPLVIKDYLLYDEMAVAALIGISSPTYFINNGARDNAGKKGEQASYQTEGIYAGLVGARFEKPNYMEWQHIIITPEQNSSKNGYGLTESTMGLVGLWSDLYGEKFPTFDETRQDKSGKYILLPNGFYFNTSVYTKRMRFVIEPFLVDAHNRASAQQTHAYVHMVGLGLGVWEIDKRQGQYILDACAQVLKENDLSSISDINFSWFPPMAQSIDGIKDGQFYKDEGKKILIHFSHRNPAEKLQGKDAAKLLVAAYAWDGNAYPGNEYWAGMLTASGDPAAACCSTIAELQNPKINYFIKDSLACVTSGTKTTQCHRSLEVPHVSDDSTWWQKIKQTVHFHWNSLFNFS